MDEMDIRTPLADFGNLLRQERVRCGYTVDEVASRLKITSRMVRAIEDGDMASMPHAVYAKGFIRAYAQLFGLSDAEVRAACASLRDSDDDPPQEHFSTPRRSSEKRGGGFLLSVVLLGLLAFGGYQAYTHNLHEMILELIPGRVEEQAKPAVSLPMPAEQEKPSEQVKYSNVLPEPAREETPVAERPQGVSENQGQGAASAETAVAPPALPVPAPVPAPPAAPAASATEPAAPAEPVQNGLLTLQTGNGTGTPIVAASAGKRHQIILTALAECWVHSSADDMDTRQLSIQKGETFALSFDRKLVIKLGNAGGVKMKYDGRELSPAGKMGQVKTLVFPQAATALSPGD